MDRFLLDTNIIIDAFSADLLTHFNFSAFFISQVVFKEEINKQIHNLDKDDFNIINESMDELIMAQDLKSSNKNISFYDALNLAIAKERNMVLVTGDQNWLKFAIQKGVTCVGTLKVIEVLFENEIISGDECIESLEKIKLDKKRRIPSNLINSLINKLISIK